MKRDTTMLIRGKHKTWSVDSLMSDTQIEAMRADGIEVDLLLNTIPAWASDYANVWCFFEDILRFRNPFKRKTK